MHNRCVFANKQQIKMQETPDAIPEGRPAHVSMCVFDSLVDEAKPGDRVEVTGVYRAVPIAPRAQRGSSGVQDVRGRDPRAQGRRAHREHRGRETARSRRRTGGAASARRRREDAVAARATSAARGPARREFSNAPPLERSANRGRVRAPVSSLAPSIWEMEEVKKALCQLFGATHKVFKGRTNKVAGT